MVTFWGEDDDKNRTDSDDETLTFTKLITEI